MPKILCLASLVISSLVFLIFLSNLLAGVPFGRSNGSMSMNIGMLVGSAIVATFSALTFREAK